MPLYWCWGLSKYRSDGICPVQDILLIETKIVKKIFLMTCQENCQIKKNSAEIYSRIFSQYLHLFVYNELSIKMSRTGHMPPKRVDISTAIYIKNYEKCSPAPED